MNSILTVNENISCILTSLSVSIVITMLTLFIIG